MIKRKYIIILLIISFFAITLTPRSTKAQTLREYKNKVAELKNKQYENNRLTNEAIKSIDTKRNAIIAQEATIKQNEQKVEDSKALVAESQENIKIKTEEIKDVISLYEYTATNQSEIYLDFIIDSSSISEAMEKQAIIEQIMDYCQKEVDSLEALIIENEKLQVQLNQDNVDLAALNEKYQAQIEELDKYIDSLAVIGLDYASQIEAQEGLIKIYEAAGCKDNDDIDICYYAGGSGYFSRPLNKGRVTQKYTLTHGGIDLGGNTPGTNVYAPANGTIVYIKYRWNCGGNIIYMHSLVDGKKYTLCFAHLRSINVKIGQTVRKGDVIGTVGGDSTTWYYDKCTSGTHLHYAISNGYYFSNATWSGVNTFVANTAPTGKQEISGFKSLYGWSWTGRG